MEKKRVIIIDTDPAKKSLSELRKDVATLREAISTMDEGTNEYNETLKQLNDSQRQIRSVMTATKETATALDGSYNALVFKMSKLREQWRATNDEAERESLGKEINEINTQLKELDASTGNFQRNVGDYKNAFTEAFTAMGGSCDFLQKGLGNLKKGFDLLKSHPIIAIIAVAVAIIMKIADGVKRNEEAVNTLTKAFAPLKAIVDVVMRAFDSMVSMIADAIDWLMSLVEPLLDLLGIEMEVLNTERKIADQQITNTQMQREMLVENAQLELDVAELKAKAAQKDKYNAETRLKLIEQAGEKQKQIAANQLQLAKNELALLELQASTGVNDAEMNDKLAQARAKVLTVQKDYNNALRETNAQIVEAKNSIAAERKAATEAAKRQKEEIAKLREEYVALMDTIKSYDRTDFQNEELAIEKERVETLKKLNQEYKKKAITKKEYDAGVAAAEELAFKKTLDLYEKQAKASQDFADNLKLEYASEKDAKIIAEQEKWDGIYQTMVDAKNNHLITLEQFEQLEADLAERSTKAIAKVRQDAETEEGVKELQLLRDKYTQKGKYIEDYINKEKQLLLQKVQNGQLAETQYLEAMEQLQINANITRLEQANSFMEELKAVEDKNILVTAEYAEMVSSTLGEITTAMEQQMQSEKDQIAQHTEQILVTLDITQQTLSELASIGEGVSTEWANALDSVSVLMATIGNQLKEGGKGWQGYAQIAAASLGVVSSILGAVADEQDTTTKEGFEKQKKLQIGQATMSMLSGIMAAWTSAMALPAPVSFILGAVQTAATAALGGAQIAAIAKQQFDGGGSSASGTTATPSNSAVSNLNVPVQYTQDVQGASIEESITSQKVYVTEGDIKDVSNKVSVAENEAKF